MESEEILVGPHNFKGLFRGLRLLGTSSSGAWEGFDEAMEKISGWPPSGDLDSRCCRSVEGTQDVTWRSAIVQLVWQTGVVVPLFERGTREGVQTPQPPC